MKEKSDKETKLLNKHIYIDTFVCCTVFFCSAWISYFRHSSAHFLIIQLILLVSKCKYVTNMLISFVDFVYMFRVLDMFFFSLFISRNSSKCWRRKKKYNKNGLWTDFIAYFVHHLGFQLFYSMCVHSGFRSIVPTQTKDQRNNYNLW